MPKRAIQIRDVSMSFRNPAGDLRVLESVTLEVEAGEVFAIIGPSGCGKTTLLRIVTGLLRPLQGSVLVAGKDPAEARRARQIGVVFQDPALLPWRTALENVMLVEEIGSPRSNNPKPKRRRSAEQALEVVGLSSFEAAYPQQLSGGMRSRVAIARALLLDPQILLMDEPFSKLDELTRMELNAEVLRLHARSRPTLVIVTHSIAEAVFLADRVGVMCERPSRFIDTVDIGLPRPRDVSTFDLPEFHKKQRLLRKALGLGTGQPHLPQT